MATTERKKINMASRHGAICNKARYSEFSAEDIKRLWEAAESCDHDAEIALISTYTGMRVSELLRIKKTDVNMSEHSVFVDSKEGKRNISINSRIMPFIERLMQTKGDLLVMRYDGEPAEMTASYFQKHHWKPLMERLAMEQHTIHTGRHTYLRWQNLTRNNTIEYPEVQK